VKRAETAAEIEFDVVVVKPEVVLDPDRGGLKLKFQPLWDAPLMLILFSINMMQSY